MDAIIRSGTLPGIAVHVLQRERHHLAARVTRYGVENGASISDHITLDPNSVEISFEMTNTNRGADEAALVAMVLSKRIGDRETFTLETEHLRYHNMAVESFSFDHSAPNRGAYKAIVRLVQAGIVGVSVMVEAAAGGRSEKVLAKDGTDKTAGMAVNGGKVRPITNTPTVAACGRKLSGGMA